MSVLRSAGLIIFRYNSLRANSYVFDLAYFFLFTVKLNLFLLYAYFILLTVKLNLFLLYFIFLLFIILF